MEDSKWWLYATLIGIGMSGPPFGSLRTWSHSKPITAMPLPLKRATRSAGSATVGSACQTTCEYSDLIGGEYIVNVSTGLP